MRPEIIKMTSGKAYRLDGYDGFTLTAVHVGAFSAILEGQVQTNLEAVPIEAEWITLQALTTQGLYPFDATTPFIRVRVLSGAPVIHLQKYETFTLPEQVVSSTGNQYASLGADGFLLVSQRPPGRVLELESYVAFKSGDDWSPAWAAMVSAALPGDSITARAGRFIVRSTCVIPKPLNLSFEGVTLEAKGTAFTFSTVPRPVISVVTSTGNGSFGDNPSFPTQAMTMSGTFPMVDYTDNAHVNLLDGSVAILLNNVYYAELTIQGIYGTQYGLYLGAKKTGSLVRGTSHCVFHLGSIRAVRGVYIQPDGNGASGGYVTTNRFIKGGFSSPDFTKNNALTAPEAAAAAGGDYSYRGRTVPADHIAITVKGCPGGSGYCYSNVFIDPYIEGETLYAFEGTGLQRDNGIINQSCGGYEMPENTRRAYTSLANLTPDATGTQQSMVFLGMMPSSKVSVGTATYTRTESSSFEGLEQSYDGISSVLTPLQLENKTGGREWFSAHPFAQSVYAVPLETGLATVIDLKKYRRVQVSLGASVTQVVDQISVINPPTKMDYVLELIIQQNSGSTPVPNFLAGGLEYNGFPQPYKRNFGTDRYFILFAAGATTGGRVLHYIGAANGVKFGTALPTGVNYFSPAGVGFWHQTEKQYYVFDDNVFYPSTPTATTALRGAVNKGATRTATTPASTALTASAAYTQAEITAVITRLEQVRARLADLEAKMVTAGQLT